MVAVICIFLPISQTNTFFSFGTELLYIYFHSLIKWEQSYAAGCVCLCRVCFVLLYDNRIPNSIIILSNLFRHKCYRQLQALPRNQTYLDSSALEAIAGQKTLFLFQKYQYNSLHKTNCKNKVSVRIYTENDTLVQETKMIRASQQLMWFNQLNNHQYLSKEQNNINNKYNQSCKSNHNHFASHIFARIQLLRYRKREAWHLVSERTSFKNLDGPRLHLVHHNETTWERPCSYRRTYSPTWNWKRNKKRASLNTT